MIFHKFQMNLFIKSLQKLKILLKNELNYIYIKVAPPPHFFSKIEKALCTPLQNLTENQILFVVFAENGWFPTWETIYV